MRSRRSSEPTAARDLRKKCRCPARAAQRRSLERAAPINQFSSGRSTIYAVVGAGSDGRSWCGFPSSGDGVADAAAYFGSEAGG